MDCESEGMVGMLAGMNYKVEGREVVGGSALGIPGGFPPPGVLTCRKRGN